MLTAISVTILNEFQGCLATGTALFCMRTLENCDTHAAAVAHPSHMRESREYTVAVLYLPTFDTQCGAVLAIVMVAATPHHITLMRASSS